MKRFVTSLERKLCTVSIVIVGASIFVMMVIEVLNALGRRFFVPFPCTVETVEALLIICVFMGLGYVTWKEEHTIVGLITRNLRSSTKRFLDALSSALGALIFGIFSWGAWARAWESVVILEVRIGVYRFPVWVFRILYAVGLSLFVLQLCINTVRFASQALDPKCEYKGE